MPIEGISFDTWYHGQCFFVLFCFVFIRDGLFRVHDFFFHLIFLCTNTFFVFYIASNTVTKAWYERRAPALIQNIKSLTYMKSWFYLQFTVRKERIPKECLTFSYNNSHEPWNILFLKRDNAHVKPFIQKMLRHRDTKLILPYHVSSIICDLHTFFVPRQDGAVRWWYRAVGTLKF